MFPPFDERHPGFSENFQTFSGNTLFPGAKTSTAQSNNAMMTEQRATVFSTSTLDIIGLPTASPTLEGTFSAEGTPIASNLTAGPTSAVGPQTTITVISVPTGDENGSESLAILNFGVRNWPWILGLLGLELSTLGAVGCFLRNRALLTFPLLPPEKMDSFDEDIQI